MQPEIASSQQTSSMHTVSNQSSTVPASISEQPAPKKPDELLNRKEFLQKLQQEGYITLKVNFQFMENEKTKIVSKKIKAKQNQTLLKIYVQMRKNFKEILSQRGLALRPQEGIFLFIKDHKIVELRSTVKEMAKYMTQGPNGSYLEITGTTIEKFGDY